MFEEALGYLTRAAQLAPRRSSTRAITSARSTPPWASLTRRGPCSKAWSTSIRILSEARALLASVYYRLNRKEDGDRERAIVQKLDGEQQAKQPGAQNGGVNQTAPVKSP